MNSQQKDYAYQGTERYGSSTGEQNTLEFMIDSLINRISTAKKVKVVKVTNTPGQLAVIGRVDVLPLVNQLDGYGNATEHQTVYSLNYVRYQGGRNAVILDPQVGDVGIAVFADRDSSAVKEDGKTVNPGSRRKYDMADGIYVGMCTGGGQPNQYVRFTDNAVEIVGKGGSKIVLNASGVVDLNP